MTLANLRESLSEVRAKLDAQRRKAGLPIPGPTDPPQQRWPIYRMLYLMRERLNEAQSRSDEMLQKATHKDRLSPTQQRALSSLLTGKSVTQAAKDASVNRATLYRWLKDDVGFQAALNRGKRELRDAVQTRLLALADKAAGCVERAIDDGDGRSAIAVLKGLGLLTGVEQKIGSDDPGELASQRAAGEFWQNMRAGAN